MRQPAFLCNRKFCWNFLLYKKLCRVDSTAAEEQMALETPLYRRRILQTGFFIQTKELEMETQ